MNNQHEDLQLGLGQVAHHGNQQLNAYGRVAAVRKHLAIALLLLIPVPAVMVVFQLVRWAIGLPAGFGFSWFGTLMLSMLPAGLWLLGWWVMYRSQRYDRQALLAVDRAIDSADRLSTADEFLQQPDANGFQQLAIADAADWVESGREAKVEQRLQPVQVGQTWWSAPIALCLFLLTGWLAGFGEPADAADQVAQRPADDGGLQTKSPNRVEPLAPATDPKLPEDKSKKDSRPSRKGRKTQPPPTKTPEEMNESRGQLTDGETSESQLSSSPSNARGAPSNQGQPSKSTEKNPSKKNRKPKKTKEKPEQPREAQDPDKPSGSTAGQGSSRGSNRNAASSDWSSRSQAATPDDEETEEDEDAEDEDEEQKSRGGVQPNLRDRRPPVNRDLQIGFGNRSNPDANGRGGPGAQKKSRGVASLVLGVPIPDRVNGQPNKGRTRVTQQRITPQSETVEQVAAEDRGQRQQPAGQVYHPEYAPWMQNLVRNYFLARRQATVAAEQSDAVPANESGGATSAPSSE